ncbi:MAG: LacI family DNA-binding transcriptional regulator [Kiritimatiellae bacterium]|jgi:LacI family transcriptional regulator|nr:LacI family DNA-binding transcriptional regulator [Kiritimatiellia bacterium]
MKASINSVAKKAGVSTATVSRVLNDIDPFSKNTKDSVLAAVKELNYVPRGSGVKNSKSVSANGNGSGTLELIFCFDMEPERIQMGSDGIEVNKNGKVATDFFFSEDQRYESSFYRSISEGVIEEARKRGYKTITHSIDKTKLGDPALIQTLIEDGADGLLLAGEHPESISKFLQNCPIPVVLVDIIANEGPVEVTTDNIEGIIQAFEHLYSLGHRDIGFARASDIPEYRERYNAFAYKMAEMKLPIHDKWVYKGPNHILDVGKWAEDMLQNPDRPTAFLCTNDFAALGILRGAINAGLKVPEDLSIVGFDDIDSAQLVTPALTSVRVCKEEIGKVSVRELIMSLKRGTNPKEGPQCRMRISPTLIERESTAAIN